MTIIKEKGIAVMGSRQLSTASGQPDRNLENVIRTEVYYILEDLYTEGKNCYLCGLNAGFEMLCAEEILTFRERYSDVRLYAIIPFRGREVKYSKSDKIRYKGLCDAADEVIVITESGYCCDVYLRQSDFLVEHSSEVIIYGGKFSKEMLYTLKKAEGEGLLVCNLADSLTKYFANDCEVKRFLQDYPKVSSFKYGRKGLIFRGNNQPFPVSFADIVNVERRYDWLHFTLADGLVIMASTQSDDCYVKSPSFRNLNYY